jgi:hypothetical protein
MHKRAKDGRRRLLRVLRETGPRKRTVCLGLLGGSDRALEQLIRDGKVKVQGTTKGALYAAA